MTKCSLCESEANISCSKCLRPICRVHTTTAEGSWWSSAQIVCVRCAPKMKKQSNIIGYCILLFVIIVTVSMVALVLPNFL